MEALRGFFDESFHLRGVAGPAVVDGEIPTDEWRSGSMMDFFRVGDVDEVEFGAERGRAFAAQQLEQSGSPRAENLGNVISQGASESRASGA